MPTLATSFKYSIRSPSHIIQTTKRIKGSQIKKEVKLSLFTDYMIQHIENHKADFLKEGKFTNLPQLYIREEFPKWVAVSRRPSRVQKSP